MAHTLPVSRLTADAYRGLSLSTPTLALPKLQNGEHSENATDWSDEPTEWTFPVDLPPTFPYPGTYYMRGRLVAPTYCC